MVINGVRSILELEPSRKSILHLQGNSCVGCDIGGRNSLFTHAPQNFSKTKSYRDHR
jgi:hypothetical protein